VTTRFGYVSPHSRVLTLGVFGGHRLQRAGSARARSARTLFCWCGQASFARLHRMHGPWWVPSDDREGSIWPKSPAPRFGNPRPFLHDARDAW